MSLPTIAVQGQTISNRYEIIEKIGQGGFAQVYRAKDVKLRREVAIKAFDEDSAAEFGTLDDLRRQFIEEAPNTAKFEHDNVIKVFDLIEEDNNIFIVMELMTYSLFDLLHRHEQNKTRMSPKQASHIMREVCSGVASIHRSVQAVHCDLKPGNILFNSKDRAVVSDLGVAHFPSAGDARPPIDTPTVKAGTLKYMPPEQVKGERENPRVDVYALGAIFFKMLTGEHYLPFSDSIDDRKLIAEEEPRYFLLDNLFIPGPIIDVIRKALAKDPNERYADAQEMWEELCEVTEPLATDGAEIPKVWTGGDRARVLFSKLSDRRSQGGATADWANPANQRELYQEINPVMHEILHIYEHSPDEPDLMRLTIHAAIDLLKCAKRAQLSAEELWELVKVFRPYKTLTVNQYGPPLEAELRTIEEELAKSMLDELALHDSEDTSGELVGRRLAELETRIRRFAEEGTKANYQQLLKTLCKPAYIRLLIELQLRWRLAFQGVHSSAKRSTVLPTLAALVVYTLLHIAVIVACYTSGLLY